jgi:hypothetical protein
VPDIARIKRIIDKQFYMRKRGGENWTKGQYGLTRREVAIKIVNQDGMCDDCGEDLEKRKQWVVDHDHDTGTVRGIICQECNSALRSIPKMRKHIAYLRRYGAEI